MITALTIGTNGRLGNQMFQYAALHGIAKANGYSCWSPGGRLFEVFLMKGAQRERPENLPITRLQESKFSFESRFLTETPDYVDLYGYFQSEKYWSHVRDEILELFSFKEESKEVPQELLEFCQSSKSLHARRTDYVSSSGYHPTQDFEYYLNLIETGERVSIFTDDSDWGEKLREMCERRGCESRLISKENLKDTQELYLMTNCNGAIIANSSFSWWGAYLGPHQRTQKVFAPRTWFGSNGPQDTDDLYLESWQRS